MLTFCVMWLSLQCTEGLGGGVLEQQREITIAVRSALSDASLWTNEARRIELLDCLDGARIVGDSHLVPTLIAHLAFSRYTTRTQPPSRVTSEDRFPVYAAITALGVTSVPALLTCIRRVNPTDLEELGSRTHVLSVHALLRIYEPGGYCGQITKLQLQLAAAQTEGDQRERLLHAASNPLLLKVSESRPANSRRKGADRSIELNPDAAVAGVSLREFFAEMRAGVQAVQSKLEDQVIWSDLTRRDELVECIEVAAQLRAPELIPALSEHLAYTPIEGNKREELALEDRYPVFVALAAIGVPAVPALVQRLSIVDPDDELGTGGRQHDLAIRCLVQIYSPGGHGRELAQLRIQLAAEEATGPFKERLLRAANHAMLDQGRDQPRAE